MGCWKGFSVTVLFWFSRSSVCLAANPKRKGKYEGSSESNVSSFIMLPHNVRNGQWWYGRKVPPIQLPLLSNRHYPTLLPMFCYMLSLCDRQQQRGTRTKWCPTWKCVWNKGVSLNSLHAEKNGIHWHSVLLADHLWRPISGCEHSEAVGGVFL